jgi:hypothetical protein
MSMQGAEAVANREADSERKLSVMMAMYRDVTQALVQGRTTYAMGAKLRYSVPQSEAELWRGPMMVEHDNLEREKVFGDLTKDDDARLATRLYKIIQIRNTYVVKAESGMRKVRTLADGSQQDVTGKDTYAATVQLTSIKLALMEMIARDWHVQKLDVSAAFLYAEIPDDEYVYVRTPQDSRWGGAVKRLRKSLYGLKTAPKAWYDLISEKMKLLGYRPTIHDPCVFTHPRKGLVLLHVDDFYVLTPTESTELYEALRKDL